MQKSLDVTWLWPRTAQPGLNKHIFQLKINSHLLSRVLGGGVEGTSEVDDRLATEAAPPIPGDCVIGIAG